MTGPSLRDRASIAVRKGQALVLSVSGATRRRLAARRGATAVLMYHRVLSDSDSRNGVEPGMFVRASTFESHIAWLRERFEVLSLRSLVTEGRRADDPPAMVVTFDDGWRDNLTVAWPILQRYRVAATIFLVRDWCAAGTHAGGAFLRPEEVRDLASAGMDFGAHTTTHPHLDRLDDREAEAEMQRSKEAVEEWTDTPCTLFAYPFGSYHDRTAAIAGRLFHGSVAVGGGWWTQESDRARIPRIGVHEDLGSSRRLFEARIASFL